jgi:hypothetical protein
MFSLEELEKDKDLIGIYPNELGTGLGFATVASNRVLIERLKAV